MIWFNSISSPYISTPWYTSLLLDTEQLYFLSLYIYSLIHFLTSWYRTILFPLFIYLLLDTSTYFLILNNSISFLYISTPWYIYLLLDTEQLYFLSIYFYSRIIKICGILIKVQILENKKVVTFDILYIYVRSARGNFWQ